jgi:hypothetical protein
MKPMRENILPILEGNGVDLVLCGHTHLYERSYLLHGHYGNSTSLVSSMILDRGNGRAQGSGPYSKSSRNGLGTVYVNTGSAGHASWAKDLHGLNHPAMCVSMNVLGSVVLDIAGKRLDAAFIDDRGKREDEFSILKMDSL